jgi:hypothetical protein
MREYVFPMYIFQTFNFLLCAILGVLPITFRRYPTVANPANCVLSAKIIFLREEIRTTQEKPAIADNGC